MLKNVVLFLASLIVFSVLGIIYFENKRIKFSSCIHHKSGNGTAEYVVLGKYLDSYILGVVENNEVKKYLDPNLPYTKKDYVNHFFVKTQCPSSNMNPNLNNLESSNDDQFQKIKINLMKEDLSQTLNRFN